MSIPVSLHQLRQGRGICPFDLYGYRTSTPHYELGLHQRKAFAAAFTLVAGDFKTTEAQVAERVRLVPFGWIRFLHPGERSEDEHLGVEMVFALSECAFRALPNISESPE